MHVNTYARRALIAVILFAMGAAAPAADLVTVRDPWIRATVPGQAVAGAYMEITAHAPGALIAVQSPLAGKAELHLMAMDAGVMKMRKVATIALAAQQTMHLKPGGYHIMLIDIKRELKAGERVPLKLTLRTRQGVKSIVQVEAEVRSVTDTRHHHTN